MQCRNDLIGRRVVSLDRGSELDRVRDVVVDRARNRVVALLLERGRWLNSPRVVPLGAVQAFGADAVMVNSACAISDADRLPDVKRALARNVKLSGAKVLSAEGKQLGIVCDVQFDEHSGELAAFEVAQGMFAAAFGSHTIVPAEGHCVLGTDAVIVNAAAAQHLLEHEQVHSQIVGATPPVAEAAGDYDFAEPYVQTYLPPHKSMGEYLRATMNQAGQAASEFWESAKQTASEVQHQAYDALEEQRIRRVLGLRVDHDIFGDDGRVVLLRGQIITPLAVAQARTAGVLEKMLGAATSEPLTPESQSHTIITDTKTI